MRLNAYQPRHRQHGLGLMSAIFVIVILALLVAGMSRIYVANQTYRTQEVLATRALSAAQSGAELHLSALLHPDVNTGCVSDATPVALNAQGLQECSYQASCSVQTVNTVDYVTIRSIGRCGSGVDSATRIVKVRVAP